MEIGSTSMTVYPAWGSAPAEIKAAICEHLDPVHLAHFAHTTSHQTALDIEVLRRLRLRVEAAEACHNRDLIEQAQRVRAIGSEQVLLDIAELERMVDHDRVPPYLKVQLLCIKGRAIAARGDTPLAKIEFEKAKKIVDALIPNIEQKFEMFMDIGKAKRASSDTDGAQSSFANAKEAALQDKDRIMRYQKLGLIEEEMRQLLL